MKKGKAWNRDELLLAINLYCKIPFGKIHVRNPDIINLAKHLDRTPGSISYKLANFASIDPSLPRKGASNVSKLDIKVWQEFFENWEELAFESEKKMAEIKGLSIVSSEIKQLKEEKQGKTREQVVKIRVNQNFFRQMVLSSYNNKCCITSIPIKELLIASHIIPWAVDKKNRLNPCNGLCLNALHDTAFDKGLITISNDYKLIVSKKIYDYETSKLDILLKYNNMNINLPVRFLPGKEFLKYHRNEVFNKS